MHGAFYLHSNGGLAAILGLDGPAHDSELFEGGAHLLCDRLAEQLGPGIIALETPVYRLVQDGDAVRVDAPGGSVRASRAIVALPPVLTGRLHYEPTMPATRDYLTQRMPIRGKIAIAALYSEPFWRAAGTAMAESPRLVVWDEGGDELPALLTGLVSMAWSRHLSQLDDAR